MDDRRPDPTPFAAALRSAREATPLSLSDLARESGVSKGYLSMLEMGWKKHARPVHWAPVTPSVRVLDDLVAVLDGAGAPTEATDRLYEILSLAPPDRVTDDAAANKIQGIPVGGIDMDDTPLNVLEAIAVNMEQDVTKLRGFLANRRGSVAGEPRGGRTEDRAATG